MVMMQLTCVRVPTSVNFLVMSKIAEGEWCAHTDPAAKSTVRTIKITGPLYLKEVLPFPAQVRISFRVVSFSMRSRRGA